MFTDHSFKCSDFKVRHTNVDLCLHISTKNTFSSNDFQGKLLVTIPPLLLSDKVFVCTVNLLNTDDTVNSSLVFYCTFDDNNILTIMYYQSTIDLSYAKLKVCLNGVGNP